jgi:succinyl-CoA synthetase beta subunit
MNVHEYQAKQILSKYGVIVPTGRVAFSGEEAKKIAEDIGGLCVIKAQIHAGGRGKAGGVRIAESPEKAKAIADEMIGMRLITHQTGVDGRIVRKVLVEEGCNIKKEMYIGVVIDRTSETVVMMASEEGGVEIEEVASRSPEKIIVEKIDPTLGLLPFQARKLAFGLKLNKKLVNNAVKFFTGLYNAFIKNDCSLAEINPLVITENDEILALDAKMNFDDNALFKHKEIEELRDIEEEDPKEYEASRHKLSYISLDGNIGCMVNGAGLAMATMDIIKLYGAEPANFLDVGGGASREQVTEAFKILISDKKVKGILINIFGGIMKCDVIAQGIIEAAKEVNIQLPLVVRLEGTNVDIGKRLLRESGLNIISADSMSDAAAKVVAAIKEEVR